MRIDGTNLSMIRGDSESITVSCKDGDTGAQIVLENNLDTIYFTVKLNTAVSTYIFQKRITEFDQGSAIIEIDHADTKGLPYKVYKYDIQWIDRFGKITTIIPPSLFAVEPEVTFEEV